MFVIIRQWLWYFPWLNKCACNFKWLNKNEWEQNNWIPFFFFVSGKHFSSLYFGRWTGSFYRKTSEKNMLARKKIEKVEKESYFLCDISWDMNLNACYLKVEKVCLLRNGQRASAKRGKNAKYSQAA